MNKKEIEDKVLIIAQDLNSDIELDSDIMNYFDSLDIVEFTMNVEKEYNIAIMDSEIENIKNINDVVELVVIKTEKRI